MRRLRLLFTLLALLCALPALSLADTRALLVACSDFITQPDLGSEISGNLQMIATALLGVSPRIAGLSIEDGTIGTPEALAASVSHAFDAADEGDLSILYLCTHGVLSSSDDGLAYLLLGDGEAESTLSGAQLGDMLAGIPGEKLLILDACFSGAIIGRGQPGRFGPVPDATPTSAPAPFLADPSIHVLTSASGVESSWYYDSQQLSTGAVSYFASALTTGLGLYGTPEADTDGDGAITLAELHRYLNVAVPSSSCQLLSADAQLALPAVSNAMLSSPLTGFSYGESLLIADEPTLDFSFTVTRETAVQYRLIDFDEGKWNWENAKTFLDTGDGGADGLLAPGRKTRTLTLSDVAEGDSGYLMLQIFALSGETLTLCSERLIAVQPVQTEETITLTCRSAYVQGEGELPVSVRLSIPAEMTVSVFDADGALVRRLCQSQLTRPAPGDTFHIFWDGRDASGKPVPAGLYTITAETSAGGKRLKAAANVTVE